MIFSKIAFGFFLLTAVSLSSDETDPPLSPSEFVVTLKDPSYVGGVLKTDKGGVITAPGLRIQAQSIEYTNKVENGIPVQRVVAEGDLMMEYQERAFVGRRLEFDLITKTGSLKEGKTFVDIWFLGGESIELKEDGSYVIYGGYITTCESQENTWEIKADRVKITNGDLLSAKDIRFRFVKIPLFWLPAFKSSLKFFRDPPIRYKLLWDKGLGPRLSMRYRIYSWEQFQAFFRFDYRITHGPGAALETDYHSLDERTVFLTKNYGAYDKSFPNEHGYNRFRFQGLFHTSSADQKTQFHAQWDRLSDDRMISDFKSEDFEINTQMRTYLTFSHQEDHIFGNFSVQPRINPFQSMNQELPYAIIGVRPFEIWKTGIISQNFISGSYLDYTYTNQLERFLQDRKSGRLETRNELYRPIGLGPVTLTPKLGMVAIYYSNSPDRDPIGQWIFHYGAEATTHLSRPFGNYKHLVQPYLNYDGWTRPQAAVNNYFVFDIEDGYARLDQLRVGIKNSLYNKTRPKFLPVVESDLYTYGFFGAQSFHQVIPKIYADLSFHFPRLAIQGGLAWNFQEHLLDYGNLLTLWTVNDRFALGAEFRHRSKFDWRKADHENFVVDFARSLSELLISPMSDRRNTLITKAHIRFSPRWNMHLESRYGWGRDNEPNYKDAKATLYTMITCSWQLRLTYEYTPNDPFRITYGLNVIH